MNDEVKQEETEAEFATATEEPIEAEVVGGQPAEESEGADARYPEREGGDLVPIGRASREVLRPLDPEQVVEAMEQYQAMLPRLLDDSDYQGKGKDRFVKKSGWRKIATAFNLSVGLVSTRVERDEAGNPVRAEVVARAVAPNGRTQDGDGYCSIDEKRFEKSQGRQKIENDLRATATTRAKNRAISDLVGMGEVSAEEVAQGGAAADVPEWGPTAAGASNKEVSDALVAIYGDEAKDAYQAIEKHFGYMPEAAAWGITFVADAIGK